MADHAAAWLRLRSGPVPRLTTAALPPPAPPRIGAGPGETDHSERRWLVNVLVVSEDAASIIEQEEVEDDRCHRSSTGRHHVPVEAHGVVMAHTIVCRRENVALADKLVVCLANRTIDGSMPAKLGLRADVGASFCP